MELAGASRIRKVELAEASKTKSVELAGTRKQEQEFGASRSYQDEEWELASCIDASKSRKGSYSLHALLTILHRVKGHLGSDCL